MPRSSAPEHITFKGGFLRGSWRLKVFSSFVMEVKKLVRATPYFLLHVKVKKLGRATSQTFSSPACK